MAIFIVVRVAKKHNETSDTSSEAGNVEEQFTTIVPDTTTGIVTQDNPLFSTATFTTEDDPFKNDFDINDSSDISSDHITAISDSTNEDDGQSDNL